jgi:hypothetical protein
LHPVTQKSDVSHRDCERVIAAALFPRHNTFIDKLPQSPGVKSINSAIFSEGQVRYLVALIVGRETAFPENFYFYAFAADAKSAPWIEPGRTQKVSVMDAPLHLSRCLR